MELFQAADEFSDLIFSSTLDLEVIYGPSASSESDHSPSSSATDTGSNSLATMDIISPPAHAKDEELDVSFEEVQVRAMALESKTVGTRLVVTVGTLGNQWPTHHLVADWRPSPVLDQVAFSGVIQGGPIGSQALRIFRTCDQ
jgi:hypothetical protein